MRGGVESLDEKSFEVETQWTTVVDETVTTSVTYGLNVGTLSESVPNWITDLEITFDGVKYVCDYDGSSGYGAERSGYTIDFTDYPFYIGSDMIATETGGSHTVKVRYSTENITVSDGFKSAVKKAANNGSDDVVIVNITQSGGNYSADKTHYELMEAYNNGKTVIAAFQLMLHNRLSFSYTIMEFHCLWTNSQPTESFMELHDNIINIASDNTITLTDKVFKLAIDTTT